MELSRLLVTVRLLIMVRLLSMVRLLITQAAVNFVATPEKVEKEAALSPKRAAPVMATMRATISRTAPTCRSSGRHVHSTRAMGPILGSKDLQVSFCMTSSERTHGLHLRASMTHCLRACDPPAQHSHEKQCTRQSQASGSKNICSQDAACKDCLGNLMQCGWRSSMCSSLCNWTAYQRWMRKHLSQSMCA